MSDKRPYIYAHEQDGEWSIILHNYTSDGEDKSEVIVKNVTREQAIEIVKEWRSENDKGS